MQPMKKEKKKSPAARAAQLLQLSESTFSGVPYAELHGDSTLDIAGYETLVSYDSQKIVFRMKESFSGIRMLFIEGEELLLTALRPGCLSVRGRIDTIGIGHGEGGERNGSL